MHSHCGQRRRRMPGMNNRPVSFIDSPLKAQRGLLEAPLKSLFQSKSRGGASSRWGDTFSFLYIYRSSSRRLDLNILAFSVNTLITQQQNCKIGDGSLLFSSSVTHNIELCFFLSLCTCYHEVSHPAHLHTSPTPAALSPKYQNITTT